MKINLQISYNAGKYPMHINPITSAVQSSVLAWLNIQKVQPTVIHLMVTNTPSKATRFNRSHPDGVTILIVDSKPQKHGNGGVIETLYRHVSSAILRGLKTQYRR